MPGGAEGAVNEGAERAGPEEGGEDLAEQHRHVVRVAVASVQVGVEGGRGARAPLEVLLQRPPLQPLAALVARLRLRLGLGLPGGLAGDRIVLAAAVRNRDGSGSGGESACGFAGADGEVEGEEAPGRRHRRRGRRRARR